MSNECPYCGKPFGKVLPNDFRYCTRCDIAVREEDCMPLQASLIYTEEWIKNEEREKLNAARVKFTVSQVKKLSGVECVLDVGCGSGMLVDRLNRIGYLADGVDSSELAIQYARCTKKGRFFLGCAEKLTSIPFDGKYDLIVANHLIEHLRNPEKFLEQARRMLKDKGYLYIETPNLKSYNPRSVWRHNLGGMYGLDHRICYSFKSLSRLL
jgi:2-polyprenyl-3-methyl-5-hydroxy-6-metoxy-1,4-benzoquinol methylase